ncbi:molybdenum cofactor sulfurase-like [Tasmannia lanceolata]|uniref:molybdenum cofactor sulfurase-like n=1 Tax=Tasmannia lanceolata TaxID=3420 RepID=UPI00406311DF
MFSKLSPFRSKANRYQKGKHTRYGQIDSGLLTDEDDYISKTNPSYSASESSLSDKSSSGVPHNRFGVRKSDVSPLSTQASEGNSSLRSFDQYSTYDNSSSDVPHTRFGFQKSDVSTFATELSEENSSLRSFEQYSTHDDARDSPTASSIHTEEIDIGNPALLSYEDAEEQFLQEHEGYFEHLSVDYVRKDQYPKLEMQNLVYLDYATSPLYSRFQVEQHMRVLLEDEGPYLGALSTFDNPSAYLKTYINKTCNYLLKLFNTTQNDYTIIFTPGLACCYRLFGEMHQFQKGSLLLVTEDNHESVRNVVNSAVLSGVKTGPVPVRNKDLCIHGNEMHKLLRRRGWGSLGCGLLIYPAQSCLSGVRHSLNWIIDAQQNGWKVLLDVSSALPTLTVDLSLYQPEFVVGSLYHMFGYPSNVGFLLVRRNSHSVCTPKGSNQLKIAELPEHGRAVHIVTEGDTLSLHTFAAFSFGFEHLENIGIVAIQKRVESLAAWLFQTLKSLKHKFDVKPLLQIHGSLDAKYRGSVLVFNVLDSTGNVFPAGLVRNLAEKNNIFLGCGTLSSPDLALLLHQKSDRQAGSTSVYASTCHLSVVRVSLGPVTTFEDAYRLVQFLSDFRDEDYMSSEAVGYVEERNGYC